MKVLIVKTSAHGDIAQAYLVAAYLKQKFPDIQIDWVVEKSFAPLVETHPLIDTAIICDTKKWRKGNLNGLKKTIQSIRNTNYDYVFDLQGNFKSGIFLSLAKGKQKLRIVKPNKNPLIYPVPFVPTYIISKEKTIREDYLDMVRSVFKDTEPFTDSGVILNCTIEEKTKVHSLLAPPQNILICPGAHWANKTLSKETWVDLLSQIKNGTFLIIHGTEKEKKFAETIQKAFPNRSKVIPKLSFPALQLLMHSCDLVIAMDSFPLHLALTTNTPTWSFFGPSVAKKYVPHKPEHRIFQGKCPYNVSFPLRCPKVKSCKTGACLKNVDGKKAFERLSF